MHILKLITELFSFGIFLILHVLAFPARQSLGDAKHRDAPQLQLPKTTQKLNGNKVEIRAESTPAPTASASALSSGSTTSIFTDAPCSSMLYLLSSCNSASPSFATFLPQTQASCLCYGGTAPDGFPHTITWDGGNFDAQASGCAQFLSTAAPQSLTKYVPLQGLCASFGESTTSIANTTTSPTISTSPGPSATSSVISGSSPTETGVKSGDGIQGYTLIEEILIPIAVIILALFAGYGLKVGLFKKRPEKGADGVEGNQKKESGELNTSAPGPEKKLQGPEEGEDIDIHEIVDSKNDIGGTGTSAEIHQPAAGHALFSSRRTNTL